MNIQRKNFSPLTWWHALLAMPCYDEAWHTKDLADELQEYDDAITIMEKWSELSDVLYTASRARFCGIDSVRFPFSKTRYFIGACYMVPKYSLRYFFFRRLGNKSGAPTMIREVRNPKKTVKLHALAQKYAIDPVVFEKEAKRMLRYFPLLP